MGLKLVIQDDNGKVLGMVDATSRGKSKPFSSGSAGYYVNGKVTLPSVWTARARFTRLAAASWRSGRRASSSRQSDAGEARGGGVIHR